MLYFQYLPSDIYFQSVFLDKVKILSEHNIDHEDKLRAAKYLLEHGGSLETIYVFDLYESNEPFTRWGEANPFVLLEYLLLEKAKAELKKAAMVYNQVSINYLSAFDILSRLSSSHDDINAIFDIMQSIDEEALHDNGLRSIRLILSSAYYPWNTRGDILNYCHRILLNSPFYSEQFECIYILASTGNESDIMVLKSFFDLVLNDGPDKRIEMLFYCIECGHKNTRRFFAEIADDYVNSWLMQYPEVNIEVDSLKKFYKTQDYLSKYLDVIRTENAPLEEKVNALKSIRNTNTDWEEIDDQLFDFAKNTNSLDLKKTILLFLLEAKSPWFCATYLSEVKDIIAINFSADENLKKLLS